MVEIRFSLLQLLGMLFSFAFWNFLRALPFAFTSLFLHEFHTIGLDRSPGCDRPPWHADEVHLSSPIPLMSIPQSSLDMPGLNNTLPDGNGYVSCGANLATPMLFFVLLPVVFRISTFCPLQHRSTSRGLEFYPSPLSKYSIVNILCSPRLSLQDLFLSIGVKKICFCGIITVSIIYSNCRHSILQDVTGWKSGLWLSS